MMGAKLVKQEGRKTGISFRGGGTQAVKPEGQTPNGDPKPSKKEKDTGQNERL